MRWLEPGGNEKRIQNKTQGIIAKIHTNSKKIMAGGILNGSNHLGKEQEEAIAREKKSGVTCRVQVRGEEGKRVSVIMF